MHQPWLNAPSDGASGLEQPANHMQQLHAIPCLQMLSSWGLLPVSIFVQIAHSSLTHVTTIPRQYCRSCYPPPFWSRLIWMSSSACLCSSLTCCSCCWWNSSSAALNCASCFYRVKGTISVHRVSACVTAADMVINHILQLLLLVCLKLKSLGVNAS